MKFEPGIHAFDTIIPPGVTRFSVIATQVSPWPQGDCIEIRCRRTTLEGRVIEESVPDVFAGGDWPEVGTGKSRTRAALVAYDWSEARVAITDAQGRRLCIKDDPDEKDTTEDSMESRLKATPLTDKQVLDFTGKITCVVKQITIVSIQTEINVLQEIDAEFEFET